MTDEAGAPAVALSSGAGRHRETVRVTLVGALVDAALGIIKIVGGWLTQSQALLADGVHSLSDLVTDLGVLLASKHASRGADADHPYGHGRIETLATVALSLAMVAVAIGIGYDAVTKLMRPDQAVVPAAWALAIAAASVISKEAVYQYTMRVARRIGSQMLRANAWHSRTDALSSVVVIAGVGGALAGYPFLDAVAAVVVAVMIAHVGVRLGWHSTQELIDAGLSRQRLDEIRRIINTTEGVLNLHMLRTRSSGHAAMADVHIQVAPQISVSEGHQISESVRSRLIEQVDELSDVTVHTDPEDDMVAPSTAHLPARSQVVASLREAWHGLVPDDVIANVRLDYLDAHVHAVVTLPMSADTDPAVLEATEQQLRSATVALDWLGELRFAYRLAP